MLRSAAPALAALLALAVASCESSSSDAALRSRWCLQRTSETFDQRIRPLLETEQPKTCNQCHLSGVDLGLFVREDLCETRACLISTGLVDTQNVEQSPILGWIARAQPESDLITQEVIDEEYQGFSDFLTQLFACDASACKGTVCTSARGPTLCGHDREPKAPTPTPEEQGCDSLAIEQAFRDSVFVWKDRCYPCHHSDQLMADLAAPRWVEVEGGCDAAAVATLRNVIDGGYVDLEQPDQSLLLLKPLALEEGGVMHGGGEKFHDKEDWAYLSFLSFFEYYAACSAQGMPY